MSVPTGFSLEGLKTLKSSGRALKRFPNTTFLAMMRQASWSWCTHLLHPTSLAALFYFQICLLLVFDDDSGRT
jgi:hypothetical protein